jgi:hypothetical protein
MTRRFSLAFECENAVFEDYPADAIADALLAVSKEVRQRPLVANAVRMICDNNGNRVGTWKYECR